MYDRVYPFAWLGILAEATPSSEELIYAYHERGFALHSMRSPTITPALSAMRTRRGYRQLARRTNLGRASARLADGKDWKLNRGADHPEGNHRDAQLRRRADAIRQLFLAGDAAHIVPPTGAKGLNLAVADVRVLARALT